ncbi:hypothetical protein KEM52_006310 [Ascosphaera acerosa]|nr:hypothetical protein KEM52_006310 [Ascosphaera acerosa]
MSGAFPQQPAPTTIPMDRGRGLSQRSHAQPPRSMHATPMRRAQSHQVSGPDAAGGPAPVLALPVTGPIATMPSQQDLPHRSHSQQGGTASAAAGSMSTPLLSSLSADGMMMMNMNSPSALFALGLNQGSASLSHNPAFPATNGSGGVSSIDTGTPGLLSGLHSVGPAGAGIPAIPPSLSLLPDVPPMSITGTGTGRGAGEIAEERSRRLAKVLALLRARVSGRGVSREGVVQLSKLEGLECMWQGDSLTIAGSALDLEIEFEGNGTGTGTGASVGGSGDFVRDVRLAYALPTGEVVSRAGGAEVLKRTLVMSDAERQAYEWKRLGLFHDNIQRLARLDRLSRQCSCFGAIEGLHASLQRIWAAEMQRMRHRGRYHHLCAGTVGRPVVDKAMRIGLALDYWVAQHRVLDRRRAAADDHQMEVDGGGADVGADADEEQSLSSGAVKTWSAEVDCEEGYPPLRVSSDWVSDPVFTEDDPAHDQAMSGTPEAAAESSLPSVQWLEPPPTLVTLDQQQQQQAPTPGPGPAPPSQPAEDQPMDAQQPVDRRFVLRLQPPVHLPSRVASDIFQSLGVPIPPDMRTAVFDYLVVPPDGADVLRAGDHTSIVDSSAAAGANADRQVPRGKRLSVTVHAPADEQPGASAPVRWDQRRHDYLFHVYEPIMGCTVSDLPFSHPRQIADVLPIFRQYALLSHLLERVLTSPSTSDEASSADVAPTTSATQGPLPPASYASNVNPTRVKLRETLGLDAAAYYNAIDPYRRRALNVATTSSTREHTGPAMSGTNDAADARGADATSMTVRKVDVSLRTPASGPPSIMLLFYIDQPTAVSGSTGDRPLDFDDDDSDGDGPIAVTVDMSVQLNGRVTVTDVGGPWPYARAGVTEAQEAATRAAVCAQLTHVAEKCEHLGMVVEWTIRWIRRWLETGEIGSGVLP